MLQAQSLRTRIELRINRIPTSLRKANMGELYEKYKEVSGARQELAPQNPKAPMTETVHPEPNGHPIDLEKAKSSTAPSIRGIKRKRFVARPHSQVVWLTGRSDAINVVDKENISEPAKDIPNPKKRSKATKAPSRQVTNPSTVLSPKSANSRTLPQSPIRPTLGLPQKSHLTYPASPLKQFSPVKTGSPAKAAAAAATANLAVIVADRPKAGRSKAGVNRKPTNPSTAAKSGTVRAKRGVNPYQEPENVRIVSNTSNISSASNATAIIKNARKAPTNTSRKNEIGVKAVGKKLAAGAEAPPPGRRVLRKRA